MESPSGSFTNPLVLASKHGHLEIVEYLLSFPDIDVNNKNSVSEIASVMTNHSQLLRLILVSVRHAV